MSPAYRYDTYTNPYSGTIADLIARQGDIRARQALTVGEAQARAAEQSGQAWGQAFSGIGQAIGAIPQQVQQAKTQAITTQVNTLKLKELQDAAKSTTVFEAALKNPDNYKPDGSIDDDKVTAMLRSQDVGAWQHWTAISTANRKNALDTREALLKLQTSALDLDSKQRAAIQTRQTYLGKLAWQGEQLLNQDPGNRLHARDTTLATVARGAADGMVSEAEAKQFIQQTAQATPDQLRQVFGAFIPSELRASLEKQALEERKTKAEATKLEAETTNLREYGRTTPGTLEEQYLHKLTTGDQAGAAQILATLRTTAAAKRDPDAAALARELAAMRLETAQARLKQIREEAEPLDVSADVNTMESGRTYIDLSAYQGKERNKARDAANAIGAIPVSKEQANALQEISNARANQQAILQSVKDILPASAGGRLAAVVTVPLAKLFQSDEQIASFNTWRTAAIQTLRATAGSKGLRINQAEIAQAIENDIPKLTDTVGVAQQKIQKIATMLENAERSILVRDRSVTSPATPTPTAPVMPKLNPRVPRP